MVAESRYRSRITGIDSGTIYIPSNGTTDTRTRTSIKEECWDTIGNRMGLNPLTMLKTTLSGSKYTDKHQGTWTFTNVPMLNAMDARFAMPSLASYTNRILSTSGPLTPRVRIPVFFYELKDLPKMLKHAGDLIHKIKDRSLTNGLTPVKEAASGTLAYQFGWGPLIQDIGRMINLAEFLANRQRTLKEAHSVKGVRRKINLGTVESSYDEYKLLWSSFGHFISDRRVGTRTCKTWAVVRWTVRDPSLIGKPPSFLEAFKGALGLNKGHLPVNVWKALPWSWAIDWFAGISDFLQAGQNMVSYRPSALSVMRTYTNDIRYHGWENSAAVLTPGRALHVWKFRYVDAYPNPSYAMRLPFMDNFKLSVLGSMSILRILGR